MALRRLLLVLMSLMLVASMALLTGCGAEEPEQPAAETPAETEEEAAAPAIDESGEIIAITDAYLTSEFAKTWLINPADLNEKLAAGEESFQLIDLRSPESYAAGHIEGAINIPTLTIVEDDGLAELDPDKTQVLIDYDGAVSTGIHMFLTQLDYEALTLRFGMSGWTTDPAIASADGVTPVWDGKGKDYPMTTEVFTAEPSFEVPVVNTDAADAREAIINGARAWAADGGSEVIDVEELKTIVDAQDPAYQIISLALPEDYAVGHIEGAISIPRGKLAKEESLKQLDPDKTLVLYCYQGHVSGGAQMFLKQLGYDVVSLRYGAGAWTNDRATFGEVKTYNPANIKGFPTVK